jgi:hypothetical protein
MARYRGFLPKIDRRWESSAIGKEQLLHDAVRPLEVWKLREDATVAAEAKMEDLSCFASRPHAHDELVNGEMD